MLIIPIEQWRSGNRLVDPTGAPYDPNSPPPIIANDVILASAIEFGRENARRIGVTLLCGLQTEATDLGGPGEFEELLREYDMYGSASFGSITETETQGYSDRVEGALYQLGGVGGHIHPFNTLVWRNMDDSETLQSLRKMQTAIQIGSTALDNMAELNAAGIDMEADLQKKERDILAGHIHLANHLSWVVLANTFDQVRLYGGLDQIKIIIDEDQPGVNIVRKLSTLGIEADLRQYRMEAWPDGIVEEVLDSGQAMATGLLPTKR